MGSAVLQTSTTYLARPSAASQGVLKRSMSEENSPARAGAPTYSPNDQSGSLSSVKDELVPLAIAAQVTYFHLSGLRIYISDDQPLAEIIRITALALAETAPIYRGERPLDPKQLNDLLIHPLSSRQEQPDLDAFHVRRGDLRDALVSLRKARL